MATANQFAANKANAQKSTGPRTDEGKAASSKNLLSHGFMSAATVIAGEDPEEFRALLIDFALEFKPETVTEQILIEKMATNQWLSLRAFRLQSIVFLNQSLQKDQFGIPKDLGLLIRYQTTADRAFHRAHNELVKAQKERRRSEIGFVPKNAGNAAAKDQNEPRICNVTWVGPEYSAPKAQPDMKTAPEAVKSAS